MIELQASRYVAATAGTVYDLVTDISRMGEWSPENQGGTWSDGASSPMVGARGHRPQPAQGGMNEHRNRDRGRPWSGVRLRHWKGRAAPDELAVHLRVLGPGCEVTETCQSSVRPAQSDD